ncbi:MAG: hypothetical protein GWN01_12860, partial [Nitrosopumilaceae archaeon]|nr:SHOCT domain-containing protein [Nitrosopumilaceae archaeon]NIU01754.1 SHOCT domain-containing protein [Nitrosopumilaceae archaeon]NIU88154.1 hypothetical protein [Nitrosopumilaceae archaeon]NIV66477.1 hypothetical protein [Nitrosopumilaceae archaeon]NIX62356.1 hypothetical protein [Nitrosopumilaceae archaeon]
FSKYAKEKGPELGKQIETESRQRWEKGVLMARKATSSHEKILDLIEKLGNLKERGLITNEEFDAKKKELLDRL